MGDELLVPDPKLAQWLASLPSDTGELDIATARQASLETALRSGRGPDLPHVQDLDVGGLHARLYRPSLERTALILYLHGGGWTIGSVASYDRLMRRLARGTGASILALDYRLAPEHPWPAAIHDTVSALAWIARGPAELGPIGLVAVAGDSAGGTLATLACHRLRGDPALPMLQLLLYPNTDLTGSEPSMRENATGFGLTADGVHFFARQWMPDASRRGDPDVSPLHASDLSGLPRTLLVVAQRDPLRDEGQRYAERMRDAGVDVTFRCEFGIVHNFMRLDQISPACAAASERVVDDIRRLLAARA